MPGIDFMKVFDAAAASLNAADHINVEALDLDRYNASVMVDDKSCIDFTADLSEYSMELSVKKASFTPGDYRKFLSHFEYYLEQKFFRNIEIRSSETAGEYRIKISF